MHFPPYSVAMCTYHGEKYLQAQLASIASQSIKPAELIVCDDGSGDNSVALIRAFAAEHTGIAVKLVVNENNLGFIKNFEQAMSLCCHEFIFLADQDDIWLEHKAQTQLHYLLAHPHIDMLFHDAIRTDASLNPIKPALWECVHFTKENQQRFVQGEALAVLLRHNVVTGATVLLRKRFVMQALPLLDTYPHDAWLALLAAKNKAIALINEPLILYRQHESNTLGATHQSVMQRMRKALMVWRPRDFPVDFYQRQAAIAQLLQEDLQDPQAAMLKDCLDFQTFRLNVLLANAEAKSLSRFYGYWRKQAYKKFAAGNGSLIKDLLRFLLPVRG